MIQIQLDPNFAMAYEALGIHYANLGEPGRASASALARSFPRLLVGSDPPY